MKQNRILQTRLVIGTLVLLMTLGGCSWSWPPWRSSDTGTCLDDDSCDNTNPLEEQLVGGTWYCYGKSRNESWDCSQDADPSKITAVSDQAPSTVTDEPAPVESVVTSRAEIPVEEEIATSTQSTEPVSINNVAPSADGIPAWLNVPDDGFAVQLIALQTLEEINSFTAEHQLSDPSFVRIESQGSYWYVLVLGIYADKEAADAAAATWVADHQPRSSPWVRPVGPLKQAALRAGMPGA